MNYAFLPVFSKCTSVFGQLFNESVWMILGEEWLWSVLVLLSIFVFLYLVFSKIAPVWTTNIVADQSSMTMYTGQFLRQIQGASNYRWNTAGWRAALLVSTGDSDTDCHLFWMQKLPYIMNRVEVPMLQVSLMLVVMR